MPEKPPTQNEKQSQTLSSTTILSSHWIFNSLPKDKITPEIMDTIHYDLFHTEDSIAVSAMNLLKKYATEQSLHYLMLIIKEHTKQRKLEALKILSVLKATQVIDELITLFNNEIDSEVKYQLFTTMIQLDPRHSQVEKLILYYSDKAVPLSPLKDQAICSLGKIEQSRPILEIIESSDDEILIKDAIYALADVKGYDATKSIHLLRSRYKSLSDSLKIDFVKTLAKMDNDLCLEILRLNAHKENETFANGVLSFILDYSVFFHFPIKMTRIFISQFPYFNETTEDAILNTFEQYYKSFTDDKVILEISSTLEDNISTYLSKIKSSFTQTTYTYQTDIEKKVASVKDFLEKNVDKAFLDKLIAYFQNREQENQLSLFKEIDQYLNQKLNQIDIAFQIHLNDLYELLSIKDFNQRFRISKALEKINFEFPFRINKLTRMLHFISITKNIKCRNLSYEIYKLGLKLHDKDLQSAALLAMARTGNSNVIKESTRILIEEADPNLFNIAVRSIGEFQQLEGVSILTKYIETKGLENIDTQLQLSIIESLITIGEKNNDYSITNALIRMMLYSKKDEVIFQSAKAIVDINITTSIGEELEKNHLEGSQKSKKAVYEADESISKVESPPIFESLVEYKDNEDPKIKEALLYILGAVQKIESNRENLKKYSNLYYHMLNDPSYRVQLQCIINLVNLGDSKPLSLFLEMLQRSPSKRKVDILWRSMELHHMEKVKILLSYLLDKEEEVITTASMSLVNLIETHSPYVDYIRDQIINIRKGKESVEKLNEIKSAGISSLRDKMVDEKEKFWFTKDKTRYLAVMFIDIVGFTRKSSSMDLVATMNYLRTYEEMIIPIIENHYGRIIKKMGDGLMIAFESSLFAVLAAIRIQERLKNYNLFKEEIEKIIVRIGINSGNVAVEENDLFGDTVNVASRMETLAYPSKILLSSFTYDEISEYIQCKKMGPTTVKGKSDPIETYEVLAITARLTEDLDPLKNGKPTEKAQETSSAAQSPPIEEQPAQQVILELLDRVKKNYLVLFKEIHKIKGISESDKERLKTLLNKQWNEMKRNTSL